jgi:peptidoglycan/LPS O-acetylase OafA/YrhL
MRRSRAVDGLRAVAVLLVLLHHLDIAPLLDGHRWLRPVSALHEAGFLGVSLFLVLSGFSIHVRVASGAPFEARKFLLRRFLRLQPTYYVAMCFAGLVAALSALAGHPWARAQWPWDGGGAIPVPVLIAVHLLVLPATIVPPGWLMVTWSLALEEQLYLVYAALVGRMRRVAPVRWLVLALAACLVYRVGAELVLPSVPKSFAPGPGQSSWVATLAFQQAPARAGEWLTGALIAHWWVGGQRLPRLLTRRVPSGLLTGAALYGVLWLYGHQSVGAGLVFDPCAGVAFGLLLVWTLSNEGRSSRTGRAPAALAWLGERSYSMYLVHSPIVGTAFALTATLLTPAPARLAVALAASASAIGAAALLYRWVEAPCTDFAKRVSTPRPAPNPVQQPAAAPRIPTPRPASDEESNEIRKAS